MRKIIPLVAVLMLGGCAIMPGGGGGSVDVQAIIQNVRLACSFAPLADTILALISQGVTSQSAIIQTICAVVSRPTTARRAFRPGAVVTVGTARGVPIRGQFVR